MFCKLLKTVKTGCQHSETYIKWGAFCITDKTPTVVC